MHIPAFPLAVRPRRALFSLASALVALVAFAAPTARAAVWLDETFEAYATGVAPNTTTSPQLMSAGTALVIDGNGGKIVRYAKPVGTGGLLQYALSPSNATPRPRGFISFKILRNQDDTILTTHIFNFRLGVNDTTTSLGSETNALIGIRFYQTSSTTNLRIYSSATQVGTSTTYNPTDTLQTVRVWYNDDESTPLAYVDPSGANQSLNANSFVVYLGTRLITPSASGSLFTTGVGANLNIGKMAFVAASNNGADMSIDDVYAADEAPTASAPTIVSATAATAYLGVPFSFQLSADGATSYTAAPLPDGLTLNTSTGVISGTPTTLGVTAVAVTATNAFALTGNGSLSITVEQPTANVFTGANASLSNTASWSLGQAPNSTTNTAGSYRDLLLDSTATTLTTASSNLYAKSWNVTNGGAYTVSGSSATQTSFRAGTTGATDTSPFNNLVSGQPNDLVYLTANSSLTFLPENPSVGALPSVFALRNPGNLRIGAGSTLNLVTAITGASTSTLTKLGAGTTIFRTANLHSGGTIVQEGVLRIEHATALGTGALTLAGGTLATTVDATLNPNPNTSGAVVINAPSTLSVPTGVTLTMGRVNSTATSAANVVTKTGPGTLRLNGSGTISAVTGGYRVQGGTVFYNTSANGGAGVGPLILDGGHALFSKGALSDGSYSGYGLTELQLLANATVTLDPHPDAVSGNNSLTFATLVAGTRTLSVAKGPNARSSADTVDYLDPALIFSTATLSGTTTLDVGANTSVTLLAASGADAGLVKTGPGRLVLGNTATAHTYTGPTTISAGTLALSGAQASALTLASGAVLQFTLNELGLPLATSSASVTVASGATIRIVGTPTAATTYTLVTADAGITGTPVLAAAVNGFTLAVEGTSLVLKPAATGGDTTPPVITLNGSASVPVSWGSGYTDAGATATDDVDASVSVQLSGTVNPAKPGIYTLTYTATDLAGNAATPVVRTVTVTIADSTVAGPDGLSPLLKYAFGATSPSDTVQVPVLSSTAMTLSLTAVIRTDDLALTVVGEAVADLAGTWGTGGTVTTTLATDQTGLPSGCVRRVFTVNIDGAARKFLRLRATLAE
ncbi:MAG: DUF5011 domain-containing protein [Burkholderiales bacterium]|nr:DUF5011 domain-containing protein [Opitutaceae bacterium]